MSYEEDDPALEDYGDERSRFLAAVRTARDAGLNAFEVSRLLGHKLKLKTVSKWFKLAEYHAIYSSWDFPSRPEMLGYTELLFCEAKARRR